jgi:beta-xylosidase
LDIPLDFFHDPDFFTDPADGTQYLYSGNGPDGRYVTIGSDMVTTSKLRYMKIDRTNVGHEANSVFYRNGHYYIVLSASRGFILTGISGASFRQLEGWAPSYSSSNRRRCCLQ